MKYTTLFLACALVMGGCSSSDDDESTPPGDTAPGTGAGGSGGGKMNPGTGTDPDAGSEDRLIDSNNYEAVLRDAVIVVNLTVLEADADEVSTISRNLVEIAEAVRADASDSRGLTFASEEAIDGGIRESYTCDAGGALSISSYGMGSLLGEVEIDECYIGTDLYDGGARFQGGLRDGGDTYRAFGATYPDGSGFSIDGDYARVDGRTGADRTKTWTDTDYVSRDASGAQLRITGLNRVREQVNTQPYPSGLGDTAGYVTLADGSVAVVLPYDDAESLDADLTFVSSSTDEQAFTIDVGLDLEDSYYDWYDQNPEEREGFVEPDFPVIDLGSPLTIETLGNGETVSVEQTAQRGENAQWDTGSMSVTAPDGSSVVMNPAADDPSMVEIRVNGAEEPILRERSDGFQVSCPGQFDTCS